MKAILEFDLPEDAHAFAAASDADKWRTVAWEIDVQLRSFLKYGHQFATADSALETMRAQLHDSTTEKGLVIE